ncbi:heavy metal translocating P-type ATPase [Dolosigranulum pigrum]|jgi:cadmium-exporting ATPase|uniref:Cd(2+)-exporting ATPase n=3 Tax=Dolosigranulum pigrum TaxID=29394 RepID=H3NEB8_9LACT|nr:heavy metal translocating P-type ATPase [Dolosigranulum pigrum]EHR32783.1 heavy metal translocating P-type ATPase [Dolosigranulum pigrum ATCC 51524]QDO91550.1 cadmium-translocating P-type ATPase [Dolosigranulum pigrum]QTJ32987.1 cadmium-translocating P-type ATPase [Dolosigranulum pigrum]QTJ58617.1 cadmium-translocating P-type ATPase [Dolosigranulum pigrum]RAN56697.1 heavy metal translocating P-type ATPase [Dolosigranulum pigrum]
MTKRLWRIIIGAAVLATAVLLNLNNEWLQIALFIISYIIVGGDVVKRAVKNIFKGQVFDENFLMSIATIGAFFIGEYPEGVAVMLFYQVGELFQSYAVGKSRKSIASLMDIRPDYANVKKGDELVKVDPDEVQIGDIIVIKAGEKIPLDGKVIEGSSMIDTSALTGESVPREVEVGSDIPSGCININGVITAEVTKEFGESTVSKILDLVENASSKKSNSEQFITKFARYYTPVVVIIAVFLAIIPPLVIDGATFSDWIYRALAFLVVSCPCALVISIPLSFFGGIGGASKKGVLVKGSNYLEALAETEIVVFDKTGTLTKGVFNVQEIHPEGVSKEELLELTAHAESYSNHPISLSLKRAYSKEINNGRISDVEEISGHGVIATVDGKKVMAGNIKLMKMMDIPYFKGELIGTIVHVAVNNKYIGYIVIADEVKEDSAQAIKELKAANIKQTVMLTGDNKSIGSKVAKELGLDKVYAELLPADKVEKLEELFSQKSKKGKLAFVGDGINDAPVLARADIGIAMGGLGSDAAIEAADVVIMTDEPSKIATAMKISKKTLKIAHQNIVFAIGIKIIVLILSAFGIATMWAAIFADVGVTIIAVLNAFRALNVKNL